MNDKCLNTLNDAYEMIISIWDKELINLLEQLVAFFLNRSKKLIEYMLIATGTMSTCLIDIKLLASLALHTMATSVIIAHNILLVH
jgi:DNA repair protein RadC